MQNERQCVWGGDQYFNWGLNRRQVCFFSKWTELLMMLLSHQAVIEFWGYSVWMCVWTDGPYGHPGVWEEPKPSQTENMGTDFKEDTLIHKHITYNISAFCLCEITFPTTIILDLWRSDPEQSQALWQILLLYFCGWKT